MDENERNGWVGGYGWMVEWYRWGVGVMNRVGEWGIWIRGTPPFINYGIASC